MTSTPSSLKASPAVRKAMDTFLSEFLPRYPTAWHLLPRPVLGKSVTIGLVSGKVYLRLPPKAKGSAHTSAPTGLSGSTIRRHNSSFSASESDAWK